LEETQTGSIARWTNRSDSHLWLMASESMRKWIRQWHDVIRGTKPALEKHACRQVRPRWVVRYFIAKGKLEIADISTLWKSGHFYLVLTGRESRKIRATIGVFVCRNKNA
jgi:hypothetical protein